MKESKHTALGKHKRKGLMSGVLSRRGIRNTIFIIAIGALAGSQISSPSKRIIEAIVGIGLIAIIWSFSTFAALSFIILLYPFPFGVSIGSSNFILLIVIFIIYMIRVSAHVEKIRSDRFFNMAIVLVAFSFILSLYNLTADPYKLNMSYIHTTNFFVAIIFFYMIINFINTEGRLRTAVKLMLVTATVAIIFTIYEMSFPGATIIPGWIETRPRVGLVLTDVRMGGPFLDFELFAEFLALNVPIIFLVIIRSRRLAVRILITILLLADLFMLFTTITRGAFISLTIGLVYLAVISRRDLNIVRFAGIAATLVFVMMIMNYVVANYTISGSLFARLFKTTFSRSLIPDTRYDAWHNAWARAMQHPIIGHAPGWEFSRGLTTEYWPHNVYLYILNITGFFGLFAFLFLLYKLFRASLPGIKSSLVSSPFPEALMKVLHVCLVMFIIDQVKIEYLRNINYVYFVWLIFGLIAATRNVILDKDRGTGPGPLPRLR